jgi:hypothetical protein
MTFRPNSMTASCSPRHRPRKGIFLSLTARITLILPSVPRWPKPPGTTTPSHLVKEGGIFQFRGLYQPQVNLATQVGRAMIEGLDNGGIRVLQSRVLAAHGHGDLSWWDFAGYQSTFLHRAISGRAVDVELFVENGRKTFLLEDKRNFIDVFYVQAGDHRFRLDIAKVRDLCPHFPGKETGSTCR